MITCSTETIADVQPEILPILQEHYEEIALYKDTTPLAPDWGRYEAMEMNNALRIYTARDDDRLIGYAIFFLNYHAHYSETLFANNDIFYLTSEYRRGRNAARLIQYSESQLESCGVSRVMWHIKVSRDWSPILERMGYQREEVIMGKRL